MKIAIVHDWLVVYSGAERVLEQMLEVYPDADLYSIVDFIPEHERGFLKNKIVKTSFIQKLPFAKKKYRSYLPLMPLAIEQFDLSDYDLVISSSHAVAKGVITGPNQLHISYIHSPIRYAWDLQHQYLNESNLAKGFRSWIVRWLLHRMRMWDARTANGVDFFIANSYYIAKRIQKVYRRSSEVIYPPVNVEEFPICLEKEDFYITASRVVPYKKINLIVKAFSKVPSKKLIVIGDGSNFKELQDNITPNITLMGYQPKQILLDTMQKAKAFVFAAEEDFGIIPVEAQACGTPVIGFAKGGLLETVIDGKTGVFFQEQTEQSLIDAVDRFESLQFDANIVREQALQFSKQIFKKKFKFFVEQKWSEFK